MRRFEPSGLVVAAGSLFACSIAGLAPAWLVGVAWASEARTKVVGPGHGVLAPGVVRDGVPALEDAMGDCGIVHMHANDTYYAGFAWSYEGMVSPYYGAFAECYNVPGTICGIVLDLTETGAYADHTCDIYVWADEDGAPGEVLAVRHSVDPGPIAPWSEFSRHILSIPEITPSGPYWVGFWGNWEGQNEGFFVGADGAAFTDGCPFTNIEPSLDFPDGWNHVNTVFGPADALGIGVQIVAGEPIGACCLQNYDCVIVPESECSQQGGIFQGSGAPCIPDLCLPATGACCLGQNCMVLTFNNCFEHDGTYLGDGTTCTPNPCGVAGIGDEPSGSHTRPMSWGKIKSIHR